MGSAAKPNKQYDVIYDAELAQRDRAHVDTGVTCWRNAVSSNNQQTDIPGKC